MKVETPSQREREWEELGIYPPKLLIVISLVGLILSISGVRVGFSISEYVGSITGKEKVYYKGIYEHYKEKLEGAYTTEGAEVERDVELYSDYKHLYTHNAIEEVLEGLSIYIVILLIAVKRFYIKKYKEVTKYPKEAIKEGVRGVSMLPLIWMTLILSVTGLAIKLMGMTSGGVLYLLMVAILTSVLFPAYYNEVKEIKEKLKVKKVKITKVMSREEKRALKVLNEVIIVWVVCSNTISIISVIVLLYDIIKVGLTLLHIIILIVVISMSIPIYVCFKGYKIWICKKYSEEKIKSKARDRRNLGINVKKRKRKERVIKWMQRKGN